MMKYVHFALFKGNLGISQELIFFGLNCSFQNYGTKNSPFNTFFIDKSRTFSIYLNIPPLQVYQVLGKMLVRP